MDIESKVKHKLKNEFEWLNIQGINLLTCITEEQLNGLITDYIKDLMPAIQDDKQKKITLKGIEPSDITNGSKYIWQMPSNSILVSACLDGLISHHDDQFWPFSDNLIGYLYGPINNK